MNRKKGQALVEFIIILPIFILMVLGIIDIGKILYYQVRLENKLEDVVTLYKSDKTYNEIKEALEKDNPDIELTLSNENNEYIAFELTKKLEILTPGLNLIFKSPYSVTTKRVIYYDQT